MGGKPKTTKKKGPKGKKARAKAKLDRQWGETAIVDDEVKTRRVGKSRLKTKKVKETNGTIGWSSEKTNSIPIDSSSRASSQPKSGVFQESSYSSNNRDYDEEDDEVRFSDSDEGSDDEMNLAVSGLLSSIRKTSKKSKKGKQLKKQDPLTDDDSHGAGMEMEPENDSEMEGSDDSDSDENEDIDDVELKVGDDSDDNSIHESNTDGSQSKDLFRERFSRRPLETNEMKNATPLSTKISIGDSMDLQVIRSFQVENSDDFGSKMAFDDLRKLSESSFEGNRKILQLRWKHSNKRLMTESQLSVYPFLTRYMDLLVTAESRKQRHQLHQINILHVLNHVMTSRSRIQRHNRQLKEIEEQKKKDVDGSPENEVDDGDEELFRDQGFTRPTVLVLLPTRGACHNFVHGLMKLAGASIEGPHMERFEDDYGRLDTNDDDNDEVPLKPDQERRRQAVLEAKGKDWNDFFGDKANQDDDFKMGMALTPKAAKTKKDDKTGTSSSVQVKLYTDFYKSDIIVASPLGLKMLIAPEEEGKAGDSDYLSSIEVCLVQHADIMTMQNWDHVNDILNLLNQEPQNNNSTDFSRVRNYVLEGQASHWRQLIISADILDPFLLSAFKRFAKSISGSVKVRRKIQSEDAALTSVLVPMKQVFQKVPVGSFAQQTDARVNYFVKNILPQLLRHKQKHTMIYIPSYFDFVALRNIFLKRELSFVSVHEYSRVTEVSRGRARFLQGRKPIMLFTGRCNFFYRHAIKGIRHLIFLGLPEHPQFYAEQVNLINTTNNDAAAEDIDSAATSVASSLALFTKFEGHPLERIVGSSNCSRMLKSEKSTFMFHS